MKNSFKQLNEERAREQFAQRLGINTAGATPTAVANAAYNKAMYDQMLASEIDKAYGFSKQGPQQTKYLADALTQGTGLTRYKSGDVKNFSFDTARQTQIDNANAISALQALGVFDSTDYAYNKAYVHLPGDNYLNSLLGDLQKKIEVSKQEDLNWANGGEKAWHDFTTRQTSIANKIADMDSRGVNYYDTDQLTDNDVLWFDEVVNGNQRWKPNIGLQEDVDRLNALYDQWASVEDWENFDLASYLGVEAPAQYQSKTKELEGAYKTVWDELDRSNELSALQASIRGDVNYDTLSAYVDTPYENEVPAFGDVNSMVNARVQDAYVKGYDDLNRFINSNAGWPAKMTAAEHDATVRGYMNKGYDYLTQQELADYNALVNAGRAEDAARYLELLSPELLYRRAMVLKEYQQVKATNPWLAVPTWVEAGAQQIANVFYLPQQIYETAVGKDNPYSSAYDALNKSQWTSEAQIGEINNADIPDWADKALTFAYKGVSGARDNFARILAGGGSPTVALIFAGAQSASGSLHESSERSDMSGAAKIVKAIGTAAIEVGTEKIGLDALFSKGQKGALQYMKNVILSEVGEETLNAMSEPMLEAVVAYLFDHEAEIMSGPEFWQNLTDTAITTAISSILMGGGGAISNDISTRSVGRQVQNSGDLEGVLRIAESYSDKPYMATLARNIRDKQAKNMKITARDVGKLTAEISNTIGEARSQVVDRVAEEAIADRLVELGESTETAKKNAPAILKVSRGKQLSVMERAAVNWSDNSSQVLKEMTAETTAEDAERTGHSWKSAANIRAQEAAKAITSKATQLAEAMTTKSSTASAVGKAQGKAKAVTKGKPKLQQREVSFQEEGSGNTITGTFERVVKKADEYAVEVKDTAGKVVQLAIDKISNVGNEGVLAIVNYAQDGSRHDMSAEEVNTMANTYLHEGGDVTSFVQQYEAAYLSGYSGVDAPASTLSEGVASIAYEHGKAEATKDEARRVIRTQKARKVEKPVVGWLGNITSDDQIKGAGNVAGLDAAVQKMTDTQQAMVEFGKRLAETAKINIAFFASKAGKDGKFATQNGSYDPNTHTVYLDINSGASTEKGVKELQKNGTLGDAIGRVAGHELTHVLEVTSPEYYAKYKQAVKDALKAKQQDFASLVRGKIDAALANGEKLTYAGAEAEVIADASEYMLQDSKFVKSMDQGLKDKVKTVVQNFLNKVNEAIRRLTGGHIESRLLRTMTDGVAHYEKRLQDLWDMAFDEMLGAEVRTGAPVAEMPNEDIRYSHRGADGEEKTSIKDQLRSVQDELNAMEVVASVYAPSFDNVKEKDRKAWAIGELKASGYKTDVKDFGIVEHGEKEINGSLNYLNSSEEIAAFACIPRVLKRGIRIGGHDNHKGRKYTTVTFAAPVEINGVRGNMAVVVKQTSKNHYKTHRVLMPDGSAFVYNDKKTEPTPAGGIPSQEKAQATHISSADYIVQEPDKNVKQKIQKSTRDDGSAYQSEAMTVADGMQESDGKRMFSLRSFNEDYDTYRAMLLNHNVSVGEVNDLFDTIDEIMKAIEKDREILDFGWNVGREDRSFNPVKPNSDPLYEVSLDFSTLCRKRLLQQTVQERLEAMYDTVLTKAERVAIRNELMKLREEGKQIEVACALCYVESTRLKSPAQIQRFFDDRRAVMVDYFSKKNKTYMKEVNARADELIVKFGHEPGTKKKELNSFQKKAVENLKQSMYKKYTPSAEEEAIIATALKLPGESFKTDKGLWNLKKEHEEIFDAYTSFVRNATKSKGIEGDEAWWAGDSKSISDKLIEKMNKENGLRTQSWSDFQVIHLLDYISAIIELSTRGAKMQSYTKVPDFVKLMGDTGVMINLSLIPKGFDGTLNYDPIEGMPIEEALALREMFPNTAGTICIGITDRHIRMLLADPNTDYVIPYHSSSLDKKTRQQMGMKVWEDFQSYQNEKNKDYPNTVDDNKTYRKKPLFSEWFDYNTVSERAKVVGAERAMQEAADRYIELCHRRGLQEKFAQFATEPNYWKLLIDRKMINQQTGEIIKQEAVQPRFNKDRILDVLSAEVNRFKVQNADKDAAVEHIVNAWENGEIRKAAKSKKVRDQVSAFNDTVAVANIVASAAELDAQEQTQKSIRDLPEDTVTYRDYLTEADSSIAATIEERNALSIYQKLLKNHAEASEKVIEAEAALVVADDSNKPEARKALDAARAKQKDLYNRLLNVERQAHVQTLVKRSNQIIGDLYGKDQSKLDKMLADKERRIASLKADITGLKGAARTQLEADIREQEREVAALKSKATKALLANSERYQQQIADIRLRRDINIEIGKRTRHIKRIVKKLNDRIIHEEDYKNVKEPLKPVVHKLVQTFIDGFGNMVFDQKTADRLRSVYDEIANEDGAPEFYSDDVANWLSELSDMKKWDALIRAEGSSSLGAAEEKLTAYSRVAEIADHIYKLVTAADEIFIDGKREKFNTFSTETGTALIEHKDSKLLVGKARDAYNTFQNLLVKGNLTPQFFFEHLKNNGMTRLFDGLMRGQTEYAQAIRDGQEAISEAKKRYNFYAWQNMKTGVQFHTEQGHDIALTVPQMMWVYATAKREATNRLMDTHHLDQGGFRYEAKDLPKQKGKMSAIPGSDRLHKLSQADVEKISNTLTEEQKACADELVSYLSNECAIQGNRASMELYGIKKYNEEYYFPFKTASDQRYQRSDAGSASTTNDARVKHTSFTHSLRKGANTPLVMGDFFDVIADHINLMATYSSFVVPIESMNRVMNTKINEEADGSGNDVTIRSLIGRKYGEASQKYIADLLKDLNGGPQTDNRGGLSALFRAFKRGAVMGSLSVTLQQPTAIIRAFAYVNPKYFAHITTEGNKDTWKRMMKHSGTAVIKEIGKFDVGTGHMANDWIANSDIQEYNVLQRARFLMNTEGWKAVKDNTIEFLTSLPGVMDRITWTHIWKAVEAEQADQHPGMDRNSDEFLDMVGKRFDDVINHTQVYDSVLAKSQNMRSKNPLTQMSTAFMSEPTLNANLYYSAVTGDHTAGQRAGIVTSVIASNILAAVMASLISAWNKDDDDRKFTEKYLAAFASRAVDSLNPMTMYPYLSDLWSMVSGYDIERTDMSVAQDIWNYGSTFYKKLAEGEDITWRDRENFYGTIANLFGIPAKNVSRDIRRIRNLVYTDKSPSTPAAIRYTLYENAIPLGLWKDSNKAYCQRLVAAVIDGDKQETHDLWDYLVNTKKPSQNTINTNIRDELKRRVQEGTLTPGQATEILRKYAPYAQDKDNLNKPKEWAE